MDDVGASNMTQVLEPLNKCSSRKPRGSCRIPPLVVEDVDLEANSSLIVGSLEDQTLVIGQTIETTGDTSVHTSEAGLTLANHLPTL